MWFCSGILGWLSKHGIWKGGHGGDGINETPVLAAADVSFAVGKIDMTLETADVVLLTLSL
jgi:hypothetical protein